MLEFRRVQRALLGWFLDDMGDGIDSDFLLPEPVMNFCCWRKLSFKSRSESSNSSSATKHGKRLCGFHPCCFHSHHTVPCTFPSHSKWSSSSKSSSGREGSANGSASKLNKAVWKDSGCHQWNKWWSCSSVDVWFRKEWEAKQKWCNEVLKQAFFTRRIP